MPFAIATDEEKKQTAQQEAGGPSISGTSTAVNLPGQNAGQMAAPKGPAKSGQFQNIQKYLSANQPQAEQMAQKVAGGVEKEVGEAQQAGQQLAGGVQQVQAYNPQDVLGNLPGATEEQKKTYQATKQTGGYTGPSDISGLQGYNPFAQEKEQALTAVGQAGTEVGQRELLKKTFARPEYSKGMTALDQALLSQTPGGRAQIEALGQKYGKLGEFLGGQEQAAQQAIGAAQQQAQQNIAAFAPLEQQAQQAILSPIEQRAAEINEQQKAFERYQQDLSDLKLNQETLQALGLAPGQRIFDVNLANYIQGPMSQATTQNIATAQERQKYNDLMNFIGGNAAQLGTGEPTFRGGAIDTQKLAADIAAKQAEFDKFAKERQYAQNFIFQGKDSVSDLDRLMGITGAWKDTGRASANLQNYLNQGAGAFSSETLLRKPGQGNYNAAQAAAQARIMDQIQKDLEAYNYNRTVGGV